jgi:hypothetical protein
MNSVKIAIPLLIFAANVPATAAIVGGIVTGGTAKTAGGTFVQLTPPLPNLFGPPDSVGNDNFQSPNLFAFNEVQNFQLTAPLTVDVGTSPIAAGTTVASHYVFFDPGPSQRVIGTVNFNSNVLAVITGTGPLAASDFLGNKGINYLNPSMRGLEPGDSVTISGPRQILFDTAASTPGDYVRVLTELSPTVPLPASGPMFGAGLIALFAFLGRKTLDRSRNIIGR